MTLAEALQDLAPVPDGLPPDVRARREEACTLVWTALQRRAARVLRDTHDADDAIATVAMRLVQAGPRGPRDSLLTEAQAEAYLATALRNYQRDLHRRSHRTTILDANDPVNEALLSGGGIESVRPPVRSALSHLIDAERWHLVDEATTVLYEELLPAIAAAVRHPAVFTQTVRDVRDLTREALSIEAIVAREGLTPGVTAENRLYQQHRRARAAFLERLRDWLRDHPLPSDLDDVVRRLAEYDMASRVPRGEQIA